ncbi:MAG TPA: sigma-54-dependent Fis family transcriptional regulator [Desulfobacteraceae bacterium]|nr:sigma-54-dependent Fis family transcriptional regulator [Desulfobacteraceae bacterium]
MKNKAFPHSVEERAARLEKEVHALKRVRQALEESERRLATLMNNLPGMVYRCAGDQHWTIEFASRGTYELLGYQPEKLVGDPIYTFRELVHPEDRPNNLESIQVALDNRESYQLIYRIKTVSGDDKWKWVWDRGEGIFSDTGELLALEGFITDISSHKLQEMALREENNLLRSSMKERYKFGDIIGKSDGMQRVYDTILKSAAGNANVILYGESGTGKELAARAIHRFSSRKDKAFVPVNCGAIPEPLMESEFFGHKKGSFSGAHADKEGYLDRADGGTLFLDELGEISLKVQVKLLRVLDGVGYMPVGGCTPKNSDFRLIAATNRDVREMIRQGKMREDFYYRVHIIPIRIPPLRERKEDIPLLVDHFMTETQPGGDKPSMPTNLRMALESYDWPGNIRELRNTIERYMTLGETELLEKYCRSQADPVDACKDILDQRSNNLKKAVETFEKRFIVTVLDQCRWQKGKSASTMGITPRTLQRKLKRYKIQ